MSVKVKITQFQGSGRVFTRNSDGIAAIIRDLAIQAAQGKVWGASVTGFTDDTTGTSSLNAIADIAVPAVSAVTGTAGESESSFNTSLGKIRNATAVFV